MQNGLLHQDLIVVGPSGIIPAKVELTDYGKNIVIYFGLNQIPEQDLEGIIKKLEID